MRDKLAVLQEYFGYSQFRIGQDQIIDHLLEGGDAVGIMPTGAGKSLCFQLPALLMEGITIVVSPLVSLMKDQVNALTQSGVKAAYLNSSLTAGQYRKALGNAVRNEYQMIYVAPERLLVEDFLDFALHAKISMVTVDEAHCISQWGQDFRPSYLQIPAFIAALPQRPVVSAFTATATVQVRRDIQTLLSLQNPLELVTGFDRPNLYFEVSSPKEKLAALFDILEKEENKGKSAIIYCSTRKTVEQVCQSLCERGYPATQYHAGLPDDERSRNQDQFILDQRPIIVATNAFGMGIDKSNVSLVLHYNMPKNLESYYQEAGRAGRDGEAANCILFYHAQDVILNRYFLEHSAEENSQMDEQTRIEFCQRERQRLKAMCFYCSTTDCLRGYLLRYFGEEAPPSCGNCYNCLHQFEEMDITIPAQKILSCVKRTGERYGTKLICDVLRGAKNQRIQERKLAAQTTYGLLEDMPEYRLRQILLQLEKEDFLTVSGDQYPVIRLGKRAEEVLHQRIPLSMKLPRETAPKEKKKASAQQEKTTEAEVDKALFDLLRSLRTELAQQQKLPPYVVFSNASLIDMCKRMPRTEEDFLKVSGVGQRKLECYGKAFLTVIDTWSNRNS